jgi:hypothetical protein
MPLTEIDYSKTIIYKIVCKDLDVKCCYTGHTTNMTKRKNKHKSDCNNETSAKHNLKVYQTIRDNRGWDNFSMLQIEEFPCKNIHEASARERFQYENIRSNMNSQVPGRNYNEWYVDNRTERLLQKKNQAKISLYQKKHYEENQEKILERVKEYKISNSEKIKEKNNRTCECNCGKLVKLSSMHMPSQ